MILIRVLLKSLVASSAEPSAAGQSVAGAVKTGKLGKHNIIIYTMLLLS